MAYGPWIFGNNATSIQVPYTQKALIGSDQSASSSAVLTVSGQRTYSAPTTNTLFHISGTNSVSNGLSLDAYGSNMFIDIRRSNGTQASPTALAANDIIGSLTFSGYGTSAYSSSSRALIRGVAGEAWTNTAQGTYLRFDTTPNLSVTPTERARITDAGNLLIGNTSGTSRLTVSSQTGVASPFSSVTMHISGTDANANQVQIDAYGGTNNIIMRQANGTQASPTASTTANRLGGVVFFGYGSTGYGSSSRARVFANATETWTDAAQGTSISFQTTATGTTTVADKVIIDNDGLILKVQPTITSKSAAATLTIAELRTQIVQYTGAVANLQLPTGTDIQTSTGSATDISFDFSVINTGSGAATLTTNTGLTLVGSMVVTNGTSGLFRVRRTGANTFTIYRIS